MAVGPRPDLKKAKHDKNFLDLVAEGAMHDSVGVGNVYAMDAGDRKLVLVCNPSS